MNNKIAKYRKKIEYFANYTIVFFALLMPINAYMGRKAFFVVVVFWVLSVDYKKIYVYTKENKLFQSLLLFSFFFMISIFWSENYSLGMKWVQVYVKYFFLPIVVLVTIVRYEFIKYIIMAFVFSMLINEFISYGIFFGYIDEIFGFKVVGNSYNPLPFHGSHISYSLYIAFTIFLVFYSMLEKNTIFMKFLASIFMITMIANLFLSSGRTGQLMFALSALLLGLIYFRKKIKYLFGLLLLIVAIFGIAYTNSKTFHNRVNQAEQDIVKIIKYKNNNSSLGVRIGSYLVLPTILSNNNIFVGVGIGDIQKVVSQATMSRFGKKSSFAHQQGLLHNTFLEILVALGCIGLSIFMYFLYCVFTSKHEYQYYKYISYLVFCTFVFSGISASFFTILEIMLLLSLFVSIIVVSSQYTSTHKNENNL